MGGKKRAGEEKKVKTAEAVYKNKVLSSLLQGDLKEIKRNFHLMIKSVVCTLEVFHVLLHNRLLATPQSIRQTITLSQSPSTSNSTMCCSPRFTHNTQQRRGEKRELSNPQQLSGPCYSIIMFDYNLISHFYRLFCGQSERRVEKEIFTDIKCVWVFFRDLPSSSSCLVLLAGLCWSCADVWENLSNTLKKSSETNNEIIQSVRFSINNIT